MIIGEEEANRFHQTKCSLEASFQALEADWVHREYIDNEEGQFAQQMNSKSEPHSKTMLSKTSDSKQASMKLWGQDGRALKTVFIITPATQSVAFLHTKSLRKKSRANACFLEVCHQQVTACGGTRRHISIHTSFLAQYSRF
jgi:hypothetical protein